MIGEKPMPHETENGKRMRAASPMGMQSAMEYLMTYGWAILIIAVVLGALYSLGVFNAVNFMPKVPGGGCHVFRPNGPGTSWNVNLVGSCNNALPQYVAQFNGQSNVIIATSGILQPNYVSITAWVQQTQTGGEQEIVGRWPCSAAQNAYVLGVSSSSHLFVKVDNTMINSGSGISDTAVFPTIWTMVSFTYDGSNTILYKNGAQVATSTTPANTVFQNSINTMIGAIGCPSLNFKGSISNVQIYNTSLTANQVAYLYNEGIGGVPVSPQYLVGWWPLNGDTNDYSGNNNNGAAIAVTFNGTWTSGYNVP